MSNVSQEVRVNNYTEMEEMKCQHKGKQENHTITVNVNRAWN